MTQEQIAGLSLMFISLLLLLLPNQIWKVTESWKSKGSLEASKGYMVTMRCLGAIFLVVGGIVFL